jgi:redox-sensitive bicupin YhaK (pirin superfamily)
MFRLLKQDEGNPTELFQIWLNLPRASKMAAPHFTMFWREQLPVAHFPGATVRVVAGDLGETRAPAPPPDSWAARAEADVAIWEIRLNGGAAWTLPPAGPDTVRTLYAFEGEGLKVAGEAVPVRHGALVQPDRPLELKAGPTGARVLLLQGRPIGEPVAQHGPFVMNSSEEIQQAFADYQATGFGGWPWPAQEPVHAPGEGRFARFPDGRVERP